MRKNKFTIRSIVSLSLLLILIVLIAGVFNEAKISNAETTEKVSFNGFIIEEPLRFKNIELFVISGKTYADDIEYVTLSKALENGWIKVIETSQVNALQISNESNNTIFILSGDIVKGGRQDRTLATDLIISPELDSIFIESFCVESGRWTQRGDEKVGEFEMSSKILSSRDLKIAAKYSKNQSFVWDHVASQQSKLEENVSKMLAEEVEITNQESPSSLQLTLENENLDSLQKLYKNNFISLLETDEEAIGLAYAINGELYAIDLFNNKKLLTDLWEKIVDAVIVEAIAESDSIIEKGIDPQEIIDLIEKAEKGDQQIDTLNFRTKFVTYDNKEEIMFETIDMETNSWIHKNCMKVDTTKILNGPPIQYQYEENQMPQQIQQYGF